MRIADSTMTYNFLSSLNKSEQRQNDIQTQLSDGKAIHTPSDDPVKTVRSLRNTTDLSMNTQYTQNIQDAQSWMTSTDGAMSSLSSVMIKANELVTSADDTKTPDEMRTIGTQVDQLINQMVDIGNTKVGDRYIFGGQDDSTEPFTETTVKDPNSDKTQQVVVYNGNDNKISMPITQGVANPMQDSVNLTGADIFGPVTNVYGKPTLSVLNQLIDIKNELQKTSTVSQTNAKGGIGSVTGTYTGTGYANFDVRIDEVDNSTNTGVGHVTGASYSTDGGTTWNSVAAAEIDSTNATTPGATTITLPSGVNFNITDSANNKPYYTNATANPPVVNTDAAGAVHADVYSFRVPQAPETITQSNTTGGAATIGGAYTGTGNTTYSVRITGTDPTTGQVTGAEYSTDAGSTWGTVPPASLTVGNPSNIALANGVSLNIAANTNNSADDTYSFQVPQGNGADATWLAGVASNEIQDGHNMQLQAQTALGTRMSMYEMASNMMGDQQLTIQTDLSNNEDIDMAKAITDFNTDKTVYESALSLGAKIMTKSLLDFLPTT